MGAGGHRVERELPVGRIVVEEARREDAAEVLALFRGVLAEGRYFVTAPEEHRVTVAWQARLLDVYAERDNSVFLVARLPPSRRVVGALSVRGGELARLRHVGRLEVFVAREHRGAGIGRALMEEAIAWARRSPLRKLSLAVFADNERAVALYRALGFEVEGRRRAEYLEPDGSARDDLLMALHLDG